MLNRLLTIFLIANVAVACNSTPPPQPLQGHWIGSIDLEPYAELMLLSYDSAPVLQCFYRGIDLYTPESFVYEQGKVSFTIDAKGLYGSFTGKLQGDTLLTGFLEVDGRPYPANLVKTAKISLESVGNVVGYYEGEPGHLLEILPYPLTGDLTALSVIDFKTGQKRVAFPSPSGAFKAGPRMLSPYPTAIAIQPDTSKQRIGLAEGKRSFQAKRLPDLERYEDFEVGNGSVKLSCTIAYPNGQGPFPLLILVPGTGEVTKADIYNDYAKTLPFKGVAVLTYDKRGCGESTGNPDDIAFETLASDLQAVVKAAKAKESIGKIGLAGHGQAGFVMPIVASKSKDIACMLSIAGAATSLEAQEYQACEQSMKASGFAESEVAEALAYEKQLFSFLRGQLDSAAFQKASDMASKKPWKDFVTLFSNKRYMARWRLIYRFDPAPYLKQVEVPIMAIYGEQDLIAPASVHAPAIQALAPQSEVLGLKGANHFMMLGEKRGDFQFADIIGYSPAFIANSQAWILEKLKAD